MSPKKMTKAEGDQMVAVHQLEDIMAIILGWLCVEEIMQKRRVCRKWKEAVKKTIVPLSDFYVGMRKYNVINVMARALPNLQQMSICDTGVDRHRWSEGEEPDRERVAAGFASLITHDIEILSNFRKLRILEIYRVELNGRYPVLFNFPLLQKLNIRYCSYLKWDLEMLAVLPLLKELFCQYNCRLTGKIRSLRVLKDTLEKVNMEHCSLVEGNFMDLADFPQLKVLVLPQTVVTGDIRDIGEHDFLSLEKLDLPDVVYGARGYELQRISDASDIARAVYRFNKKRPELLSYVKMNGLRGWYARLSRDSPDWYESAAPTFYIRLVEAGSRVGYRWENFDGTNPCEVNWLDPEPDRESSGYAQYTSKLHEIQDEVEFYRGFHQPPTEEEYNSLWGE
jgi:hypothetical protein